MTAWMVCCPVQGWLASLLAKAAPHVPPVSAESGLSGLEGLGVHAGMTKEQVRGRVHAGITKEQP